MSHDTMDSISGTTKFTFDEYRNLISQISDIRYPNTEHNEIYTVTHKQRQLTTISNDKKNNYKKKMASNQNYGLV